MWIKKFEYLQLKSEIEQLQKENKILQRIADNNKNAAIALERETRRLSELITSKVKDCQVGPWCKDCVHYGSDWAEWTTLKEGPTRHYISSAKGGKVQYCKKHLHEMCPEWEADNAH